MRSWCRKAAGTAVLGLVLATSGCGFKGVYSLPLPGAKGAGAHTFTVGVQFGDVLDLVPYSAVMVNGATVGHVRSISVQGTHALVVCQLESQVRLPANAVARVEQTSVLGEKFVELEPPPAGIAATGRLRNGDVIPLERTQTDATVEDVLGALSMLLSGGGVGQLQSITHEVDAALAGRAPVARDLLDRLSTFAAGLDRQKGAIIRALRGVDALTHVVRAQESTLVTAVTHLPAAEKVLSDDRERLVTMLSSVRRLGSVATHVENASHADLVANLRHLRPTLASLAAVGATIPKTLGVLITYPTADTVEQEYFGDYGNLSLTVDVSAKSLAATFGPKAATPTTTGRRTRQTRRHKATALLGTLPLPGAVNDVRSLLLGGLL